MDRRKPGAERIQEGDFLHDIYATARGADLVVLLAKKLEK